MTKEEEILKLKSEISECENKINYYNAVQMALKLVMNGSYGAIANKGYACFNSDIANAITCQGRHTIRYVQRRHEDYWYNLWHIDYELHKKLGIIDVKPLNRSVKNTNDTQQVVIYSDTDSLFFSYIPVYNSCTFEKEKPDVQEFIFSLYEQHVNYFNDRILTEYADLYYVENIQDFELEKYAEACIFLAKKKYIAHVRWDDGQQYDRLKYIYPKGIEVVKNSTPYFVREKIMELITFILDGARKPTISELTRKVKNVKKLFENCNTPSLIDSIAMNISCNNYKKYVADDNKEYITNLRCPIGVKAASYHNYLLNNNSEYKIKYNIINSGEKIKYYYTTDPNHKIFGYIRNSYPVEFAPPMDVDLMFKKTFLSILNRFNTALSIPEYNARLTIINSLFENL
jgi:DNA polymerase elongation subunit (family B)